MARKNSNRHALTRRERAQDVISGTPPARPGTRGMIKIHAGWPNRDRGPYPCGPSVGQPVAMSTTTPSSAH